jgi:RNA polymerase sigma-70 factor (ECF subfamily)
VSLLIRLRNAHDDPAWREFVAIYEPLIYRLGRRGGLQHADALELTQEALLAVAKSIDRWDTDPCRGSFRGWLYRVSRNLLINFMTRQRRHPQGVGDTDFQLLLAQQPDARSEETSRFEVEYRRRLFQWAVEEVRDDFQDKTWNAFWNTCVLGRSVKEVAAALDLTVGAVYVARSRVMARLKKRIEEVSNDS